ncbi:MAG TPA: hypothetical protein VE421_01475 [Burkholderiaceae bacterium]|nr:hypothetical protein [Burkholderiaceae bacterium]
MKDKHRIYGARISALAASVALTLAAAIGLTTASQYQGPRADAPAQGAAAAADGGAVSLPPRVPHDDPELMRIDRANDYHG